MEYVKEDFVEAKHVMQRELVITNEDLARLEANVLQKASKKKHTAKWIGVAVAAVVLLGVGIPVGKMVLGSGAVTHSGSGTQVQTKPKQKDTYAFDGVVEPHGRYIIHNNSYFVPTDQEVSADMVGTPIGSVKRIGDWSIKREGDSNYYPPHMNVYYQLKGVDPSLSIVVKAKDNSADPGKYIVFKNDGKVKTDTSKIFNAKTDAEEVGIALKNIAGVDPYLTEIKGMGDRAQAWWVDYTPPEKANSKQPVVSIRYLVKEADQLVNGVGAQGILTVQEYGPDLNGVDRAKLVGDSASLNLKVEKEFDVNGFHWTKYNDSFYLGQKGDTTYEWHLQGSLSEAKMREFMAHFQVGN